ncbi:uncharacterized protein [Tiliqua scincoides]|uniref:uncharacterized protein n=1 Tax=Tiliqua scincoides TaxID=71010 RepID=UPI003461ACCB
MAERAALRLNMTDLLRNGSQRALHALLSFLIHQVKRVVVNLLYAVVVVVGISTILISAIWLASEKMDYSPMSPEKEVAMPTNEWLKPYHALQVLKDALLYVAALLPCDEPLTVGNLLKHRDRLGSVNYILRACFDRAIDAFSQEPHSVQQNAKMVLSCDGQAIKFRSGRGDCEIMVYFLHEEIRYSVQERTSEMYLARLSVRKEPLSTRDLLRVRHSLQIWGVLSPQLGGCLDFAVQEFAKEPFCVQDDAHMVIDCDGQVLRFTSGSGKNDINVYDARDGSLHYRIRSSGLWAGFARFFGGNQNHVRAGAKKFLQLE